MNLERPLEGGEPRPQVKTEELAWEISVNPDAIEGQALAFRQTVSKAGWQLGSQEVLDMGLGFKEALAFAMARSLGVSKDGTFMRSFVAILKDVLGRTTSEAEKQKKLKIWLSAGEKAVYVKIAFNGKRPVPPVSGSIQVLNMKKYFDEVELGDDQIFLTKGRK